MIIILEIIIIFATNTFLYETLFLLDTNVFISNCYNVLNQGRIYKICNASFLRTIFLLKKASFETNQVNYFISETRGFTRVQNCDRSTQLSTGYNMQLLRCGRGCNTALNSIQIARRIIMLTKVPE